MVGPVSISERIDEAHKQGIVPAGDGPYTETEVERGRDFLPDRTPERVTLAQLDMSDRRVAAAVGVARAWQERKGNHKEASVVLLGPTGVGKTTIATAILWSMQLISLDAEGKPVEGTERPAGRFYLGNELIQRMEASTPVGQLVGNAPIVVIDDVGSEQSIAYIGAEAQLREKQQRYFRVVDYCYQAHVSLVITSNLSPAGLREVLGDRAWSRLQAMAPAGFMVDLTGVPDWRARQSGRG